MVCWSLKGKTPMMRSMVLEASMVCRVDKTRWPVSAASRAISIVIFVAHLADQDHFRSLPEGGPEGQGKSRRIAVQLPLVDGGLLVVMEELDGVFNRQDGRQRGGFS